MELKDLVSVVKVLMDYQKNPVADETLNKRVEKRIATYMKKVIKMTDATLKEKGE